MLDKFTIKELLILLIHLNMIGLVGVFICVRALYIGLKDHAAIYKTMIGEK